MGTYKVTTPSVSDAEFTDRAADASSLQPSSLVRARAERHAKQGTESLISHPHDRSSAHSIKNVAPTEDEVQTARERLEVLRLAQEAMKEKQARERTQLEDVLRQRREDEAMVAQAVAQKQKEEEEYNQVVLAAAAKKEKEDEEKRLEETAEVLRMAADEEAAEKKAKMEKAAEQSEERRRIAKEIADKVDREEKEKEAMVREALSKIEEKDAKQKLEEEEKKRFILEKLAEAKTVKMGEALESQRLVKQAIKVYDAAAGAMDSDGAAAVAQLKLLHEKEVAGKLAVGAPSGTDRVRYYTPPTAAAQYASNGSEAPSSSRP